MIFGVALITVGYAIFYWGLHHFNGVDCPGDTGNNCRYSLVQLLGLDKFGIAKGIPVAFK